MEKLRYYIPKVQSDKLPVIIGLPGLVHPTETTRIDSFLETISKNHNIAGVRMNYEGITSAKNTISCQFNLKNYISDIERAIFSIKEDERFNQSRIGILASSISAGIFGHYLSNQVDAQTSWTYASISPLLTWTDYASEEIRRNIQSKQKPIPISSSWDEQNGIRRQIPFEDFEEIKKLDALSRLQTSSPKLKSVLTFLGAQDTISNPNSILKYHDLLNGNSKRLIIYEDLGHDISLERISSELLQFFKKNLLRETSLIP
ncbi:hypothetical protein COU54_03740 [Candidatus Pacearchaeota archaeon CG10_big_fil_rev_8_21_14_0_10_31_24]|nr:MAG: hypothetical protein COU54_03740 [Candidatus Pacearchaeota archaeon CG10_big_fil_rev_8_21_14_0_10_31_24]